MIHSGDREIWYTTQKVNTRAQHRPVPRLEAAILSKTALALAVPAVSASVKQTSIGGIDFPWYYHPKLVNYRTWFKSTTTSG